MADSKAVAQRLYNEYPEFDHAIDYIMVQIDDSRWYSDGITRDVEFWEDVMNEMYNIRSSTPEVRERRINNILK